MSDELDFDATIQSLPSITSLKDAADLLRKAEAQEKDVVESDDPKRRADAAELVMRIMRRLGELIADRKGKREDWIAAARRDFRPGRRRPCFVCGKYQYLTHAHHLYPLAKQFEKEWVQADQRHVWLCPNHHAMVHQMIDDTSSPDVLGRKALNVVCDLADDEIDRLLAVVRRNITMERE